MKQRPEISWKLRAADERAKREAAEHEAAQLRTDLQREQAKVERWINRNNDLWNALAKLPGGLEEARRLKA
jgi:hypothetical protein